MKFRLLLLTVLGTTVALFSGWFIDERQDAKTENPLQVPDNIDYYLAGVSYQAFNTLGSPRFQLQTPYLEHYIREDTSQLTEPALQYFAEATQWQLNARQGQLRHAEEIFELEQEALLQRLDHNNPMSLSSAKMVFHAEQELVEIPQPLQLQSQILNMQAASAMLDMRNKRHQFSRVRATYTSRQKNVAG